MKITKEQIKGLKDILEGDSGHSAHYIKTEIKELFPEVFETKYKKGTWYEHKVNNHYVVYCTKDSDELYGYGTGADSVWYNDDDEWYGAFIKTTASHVLEVLTEYAKGIGLVEGVDIISPSGTEHGYVLEGDYNLWVNRGVLFIGSHMIMSNGKWATPIKKVTMEDIYKKFGQKVEII